MISLPEETLPRSGHASSRNFSRAPLNMPSISADGAPRLKPFIAVAEKTRRLCRPRLERPDRRRGAAR